MTVDEALDAADEAMRAGDTARANELKARVCDVLVRWLRSMPFDDWRDDEIAPSPDPSQP